MDTLSAEPGNPNSPWRPLFEQVRLRVGNRRDENGSLGSINWLRHHMQLRGANPNVVRNIIYRDKGRLPDKRVLFAILQDLCLAHGKGPLDAPELEALLASNGVDEGRLLETLGRDKRRAFRAFVNECRLHNDPKMLVVGRAGSGKTLLLDTIEQALKSSSKGVTRIVRVEFSGHDLASALGRLAAAVGVDAALFETRLVKVGGAGAYAVQADAQAELARSIVDEARHFDGPQTLLLHISHTLGAQDVLGRVPLRLNDAEVTRVSASEWLWVSIIEPLARIPRMAMLVSIADLPLRAQGRLGAFREPIRLSPPSLAEARRFVRHRLPHASETQVDQILRLAGRSFEELRTLTLLAEIRDPAVVASGSSDRSLQQLAKAIEGNDDTLRHFLAAIATLSLPSDSQFQREELDALLATDSAEHESLRQAFLDPLPGRPHALRVFSRDLAGELRRRLLASDPLGYRSLHERAAAYLHDAAAKAPRSEIANRHLTLLLEARAWPALLTWMHEHGSTQALVERLWPLAEVELQPGPLLAQVAQRVAAHYVKLGTFTHPDVQRAFALLDRVGDEKARFWTTLRRAEGLSFAGRLEQASLLLAQLPEVDDARLGADAAIAHAGIARWRGQRTEASRLVLDLAPKLLKRAPAGAQTDAVRIRARLWAGLMAKDQGDYDSALAHFASVPGEDDLVAARVAFQCGDIRMRLGHYDQAQRALAIAVERARRSDALATEQTRYLARLATVHRRRSDHVTARATFNAASTLLDQAQPVGGETPEQIFWRARLEDEAGLLLLAERRFDEATVVFSRNLRRFRDYAQAHDVDATYRVLRSTLRLAITYGCRAVGQAFLRPFAITPELSGEHPDLVQARRLLFGVLTEVEHDAGGWALSSLALDTLLILALFSTPADALAFGERAVAGTRYPYARAQALAHTATAAMRSGDRARADELLTRSEEALQASAGGGDDDAAERGDLELAAWLVELRVTNALLRGDGLAAGDGLAHGLADARLQPHHQALLRSFGEAVNRLGSRGWERSQRLAELFGWHGDPLAALELHNLRLPDALASHWARLPERDAGVRRVVAAVEGVR
jgi:tetratricopeptide (TPR) repeat protein